MSGHTSFTSWINSKAEYVLVDGKKANIISTFFTSGDMHNSDVFNIKTDRGTYSLFDKRIDKRDLSIRSKRGV